MKAKIFHQKWNSRGNYNYNANTYFNTDWMPHFHKNFELIYVLDGKLSLTVNGTTEEMREGDYALILSNQIHSFHSEGRSNIWIAIFSEQFVPHFAGAVKKLEGKRSVFRCEDSVHAFVFENLLYAESSVTMKKACFYALCDQYLKQIPLSERKSRNDDLICRLLDYVEEHYREDLTLTSVAEQFGYEYHYLSRILNQSYHINFSSLVNEYRLDHAVRLLETTDKSITDIAMESGFQSIRNFNHVFQRVIGVSPANYLQSKGFVG